MRIRLVRSRKDVAVPDASGKYISVETMPTDERSALLAAKLLEEVGEFIAAWYIGSVDEVLEEGADIFDVVLGFLSMVQKDERALVDVLKRKREAMGDFKTALLYEEYPAAKDA